MISIEQLNGEIAALNEEVPTHAIMQKLAALYVVRDHIGIGSAVNNLEMESIIPKFGDSEFAALVEGKTQKEVWPVIDELMATLQVLNPRLYKGVLRKIT